MKIIVWLLIMIGMIACPGCTNTSAQQSGASQWIVLFDGSNMDAWRLIHSETFPQTGWKIEDMELVFDPAGKTSGDIITKQKFGNFVLELEFKLTKGANSGIKYFVVEEMNKGVGGLGLEYQILDDQNHPDAKNGRDGNRTIASLYDLIPANTQKPVKPIGQWNTARIISKGMHVEHWLNGRKVLEYERGSKAFRDLITISKYKDIKGFGLAESGHILLQDHGDKVFFRNIRIQILD